MSTKIDFILASASPARKHLLQEAGLAPHIEPVDLDEQAVIDAEEMRHDGSMPKHLVTVLAREKARLCAKTTPLQSHRTLILGCDSMLEVGGDIFGKPHTSEVATERIKQLRGNWVTLWTGHYLIERDQDRGSQTLGQEADRRSEVYAATSTRIKFGDISDDEIKAYVTSGEPLEVAGAFTLDGLGSAFIEKIDGDPQNVIGVSVYTLRQLAKQLGVFWPDLWSKQS